MKINDIRKNFQNITFSNYKKTHVIKELYNSLYYEKKDESLFWTCELLCSGLVLDIWNVYIQYVCKHIHIHNPKLILYLVKKFNEEKFRTELRKREKLPIKRTYDENDFMAFDTLETFSHKHRWPMIVNKVINNPDFYAALNSLNKKPFNIR